MKLIAILFLSTIYIVGVKTAAISPDHEGYNYDRPEPVYDQQVSDEPSVPIEEVAERVGIASEAISNNELAVEINQELPADDIDLRYSEQNNDEVQAQQAEEIAVVAQEETQEQVGGAEGEAQQTEEVAVVAQDLVLQSEPQAEIAVAEESEPQQTAAEEVSVNVRAGEEAEDQQQTAEAEIVAHEEPVEEVQQQQVAVAASTDVKGYDYDPPASTFAIPQPSAEQLAIEAAFVHQDLGSEHESHRHGGVKRLKLKGPQPVLNAVVSCGDARDWLQVVVERSQVRPKNRRLIPYTEEIADASYFVEE